ncbi:hypothetical protein ABL78_6683 [Leptomonas seymouri]|uniref:Uncharacterized protein n=1 Tax=Leptomonas seymouri TaxID=5684 RepID=A0A0N0P3L6_LEPSE|nr:hypothetical protein ABL78_6683 [Leptomonas seymouri]|eukprot:KPI84269.1 hypothetical protein ABL78_6683 [Leptomonas seymouri]
MKASSSLPSGVAHGNRAQLPPPQCSSANSQPLRDHRTSASEPLDAGVQPSRRQQETAVTGPPAPAAPGTWRLCILAAGVLVFHVLTSVLQERIFHLPGFSNVLLLSFGETACTAVLAAAQLVWTWWLRGPVPSERKERSAGAGMTRARRGLSPSLRTYAALYRRVSGTLLHIFHPSTVELRWYVLIALLMSCSLYLTNRASILLSYPLQVIFKSSKLLCMVIVRRWWVRRQPRGDGKSMADDDSELESLGRQQQCDPPHPSWTGFEGGDVAALRGRAKRFGCAAEDERLLAFSKLHQGSTRDGTHESQSLPFARHYINSDQHDAHAAATSPTTTSTTTTREDRAQSSIGQPQHEVNAAPLASPAMASGDGDVVRVSLPACVVNALDARRRRSRLDGGAPVPSSTRCSSDDDDAGGERTNAARHCPFLCNTRAPFERPAWWLCAVCRRWFSNALHQWHSAALLTARRLGLRGCASSRTLHDALCLRRGIAALHRAGLRLLRGVLQDGELQACTVIVLGLVLFTCASQPDGATSLAAVGSNASHAIPVIDIGVLPMPIAPVLPGEVSKAADPRVARVDLHPDNTALPPLQQRQQPGPTQRGSPVPTAPLSDAWRAVADLHVWWTAALIGVPCVLLSNLIDAVIYVLEEVHCFQTTGSAAPASVPPRPSPLAAAAHGTQGSICKDAVLHLPLPVQDEKSHSAPMRSPACAASASLSAEEAQVRDVSEAAASADDDESTAAAQHHHHPSNNCNTSPSLWPATSPHNTDAIVVAMGPAGRSAPLPPVPQRVPATSLEVLLMLNGFAAVLYFCGLALPWVLGAAAAPTRPPSGPPSTATPTAPPLLIFTALIILISATSLIGTMCLLAIVAEYTGVTAVVVTNVRKTLTIFVSFLLYERLFTPTHAIGLAAVMGGVAWNEFLRRQRTGAAA